MKTMRLLSASGFLMLCFLCLSFKSSGDKDWAKDYQITIGGITAPVVEYAQLAAADDIRIVNKQDPKADAGSLGEITGFTFAIAPKNGSNYIEVTTGSKLTPVMKQHLKAVNKGDLVVLANVYFTRKDGMKAILSGVTYKTVSNN